MCGNLHLFLPYLYALFKKKLIKDIISKIKRLVLPKRPVSWTSTPSLEEQEADVKTEVTVSIALPKRRHTGTLDEQIAQIVSYVCIIVNK